MVDYLAVLDEDAIVAAIGGLDHRHHPDGPTLYQLATDPPRQSQGFGSAVVQALEAERIGRHHATVAELVKRL